MAYFSFRNYQFRVIDLPGETAARTPNRFLECAIEASSIGRIQPMWSPGGSAWADNTLFFLPPFVRL